MLPFGVTIPATVPQGSEIPEGLMNNPVYFADAAAYRAVCVYVVSLAGRLVDLTPCKGYNIYAYTRYAAASHNMVIHF